MKTKKKKKKNKIHVYALVFAGRGQIVQGLWQDVRPLVHGQAHSWAKRCKDRAAAEAYLGWAVAWNQRRIEEAETSAFIASL